MFDTYYSHCVWLFWGVILGVVICNPGQLIVSSYMHVNCYLIYCVYSLIFVFYSCFRGLEQNVGNSVTNYVHIWLYHVNVVVM